MFKKLFLILLLAASINSHAHCTGRALDLETYLDNMCGDTWCEGGYQLQEIKIYKGKGIYKIFMAHSSWGDNQLRYDYCELPIENDIDYFWHLFVDNCLSERGL